MSCFIEKVKFLRAISLLITLSISAILFSHHIYAQKSPLWGNLEPGSYSVGFKVFYKYDYSRSWKPKRDFDGQLTLGTRARPIRISVWYPAQKQANSRKAFYRDYVFYKTADKDFAEANNMLEERDLQSLRFVLKKSKPFKEVSKTHNKRVSERKSAT